MWCFIIPAQFEYTKVTLHIIPEYLDSVGVEGGLCACLDARAHLFRHVCACAHVVGHKSPKVVTVLTIFKRYCLNSLYADKMLRNSTVVQIDIFSSDRHSSAFRCVTRGDFSMHPADILDRAGEQRG